MIEDDEIIVVVQVSNNVVIQFINNSFPHHLRIQINSARFEYYD